MSAPLLPNAVKFVGLGSFAGCCIGPCNQMRKKSLANACLQWIFGLWIKHVIQIRASMELHCSLKTFGNSLPKVKNSVTAVTLERIPLGLLQGPMFYLLALGTCFNYSEIGCIVNIHWAKLNTSSQVLTASLNGDWPCSIIITRSSESLRRNLCAKALYNSNRLFHLPQKECRWQEHSGLLLLAFHL